MFRQLVRAQHAALQRSPTLPIPRRLRSHSVTPSPTLQAAPIHTAPDQPPITTSSPDADPDPDPFATLVTTHPALHAFRQTHHPAPLILTRSALVPPPAHVPYNLTCTTLSGPDLIAPQPYVFTAEPAGAVLAFYRLGRRLAGHAGLVHGGVLAVLLDECMCRAGLMRLPGRVAVTARLEVEYLAPVRVGGEGVVVHAETVRVEGRKAWVRARVEDVGDGGVVVRAEGLFVQPRWAGEMVGVYEG